MLIEDHLCLKDEREEVRRKPQVLREKINPQLSDHP